MQTYRDLMGKGWTINDIDNMDFMSFVANLAYSSASRIKQAYIDDIL